MWLNQTRLARAREALRERRLDVLDLLPRLFQINHPLFPGYVSKEAPIGVTLYETIERQIEIARCLSRSFEYERRHQRRTPADGVEFYLINRDSEGHHKLERQFLEFRDGKATAAASPIRSASSISACRGRC